MQVVPLNVSQIAQQNIFVNFVKIIVSVHEVHVIIILVLVPDEYYRRFSNEFRTKQSDVVDNSDMATIEVHIK